MSFTTNTGRLSSANPGMQQIPTRGNTKAAKETAKAVKRVFRPRHDPKNPRVISSADFSQAEVRWLAEMSGDETLTKLFVQRAEAMERYRRKPSVELWKKIEDHYDLHRQTAAFMNGIKVGLVTTEQRQVAKALCVVGSTRVPTSRGLVRIDDLSVGTKIEQRLSIDVATPTGTHRTTKLFVEQTRALIKIRTRAGYTLEGTPDHPVMVLDPGMKLVEKTLGTIDTDDVVTIKPGSDLWALSKLEFPKQKTIPDNCTDSVRKRLRSVGYQKRCKTLKVTRWPTILSEDLGWFVGLYVAEGHGSAIVNKNRKILRRCCRILADHFGPRCYSQGTQSTGVGYINFSKDIVRALSDLGASPEATAELKVVPEAIYRSPSAVVCAFLKGYFQGDGSRARRLNVITATSASQDLIEGVQLLLLNLGVVSGWNEEWRTLPVQRVRCPYYKLTISGDTDVLRFTENVHNFGTRRTSGACDLRTIPGLRSYLKQYRVKRGNHPVVSFDGRPCPGPCWEHTHAAEVRETWLHKPKRQKLGAVRSYSGPTNYDLIQNVVGVLDPAVAETLRTIVVNGLVFDRPATVKHQRETATVYDLRVPAEPWFVSNGIISHNCFGVIYGMTIFGLAARLGVDRDEADRLLNLWLNQFPDAREWLYAQEDDACEHGRVLNPIGRVRHLPALLILGSGKSSGAGHMKRVARNAPIQSIASDTTLWVAIQLQDYIDANHLDWQIIGLVHDSIVSELPWADLQRYTRFVRSLAADSHLLAPLGVPVLKVPMEMEVEAGRSYGELTKLSINDAEMETQIADMEATLLAA
jgi:intein/homing endonuclease